MRLKSGQILKNTYRIVRKLGTGGEGSVYLTIHERTCSLWAVKVIPAERITVDEEEVMNRLQLAHPGLPKVVDIWQEEREWFFVMEYVSGMTLEEIRKEARGVEAAAVKEWMMQLCDILKYLHQCSPMIVYGDLKPANIICREDGKLVLTDFGSMRRIDARNPVIIGTRAYAAPEQYESAGRLDARTDIYSLGLCMQVMLKSAERRAGSRKAHDLERILRKCTRKRQEQRYESCVELLRDLRKIGNQAMRTLLGALATCVFLAAVATGAARMELQAAEEAQYQQYLDSYNISNIKSAIILNPYRDEAYHKLLEQITEDYWMEPAEEAVLLTVTETYEHCLEKQSTYAVFAYQTAIAYWYYSGQVGGKRRAVSWFQKALNHKGLSTERQQHCKAFIALGSLYDYLEERAAIQQEEYEAIEVWNVCQTLLQREVEDSLLSLRVWDEVLGICYARIGDFLADQVKAEAIGKVIAGCTKRTSDITNNSPAAVALKESIQLKKKLIEDVLEIGGI